MNIAQWYKHTVGTDAPTTVAANAHIAPSSIYRQIPNKLSPENVVKIAHAYSVPAIEGLVALGLLTDQDITELGLHDTIKNADNQALLDEIHRRLNETTTDPTTPGFDPTQLTDEQRERLARQRLHDYNLAANTDPHLHDEIEHGSERY